MSFHFLDSGHHDGGMGAHSAERQLWCAVIERALHDAMNRIATVSGPSERHTICQDARNWFAGNGGEFRAACEAAGYDPDYLRSHILSLICADAVAVGAHLPAPAREGFPDQAMNGD